MSSSSRAATCYFGYIRPIALALSRPALTAAALRVAVEALRSFFYPQFENALLRLRPLVNVDHPIDPSIPFEPGHIRKYLEFVKLWMGTFHKIWLLYGYAAQGEMIDFLASIRRLYAEAGSVYQTIQTTTTRPAKNYNLRFALIHAVDPHQNCVPSLHVLLVVANWLLATELVRRLGADTAHGMGPAEVALWLGSLRNEAVAITESVLFVKQHSVNCIGASLYYLKSRYPTFGAAKADAFVRDLFASEADALANADELRGIMLEACASLEGSLALRPDEGWRKPLLDFIMGFAE
jgi:hypothetical protein